MSEDKNMAVNSSDNEASTAAVADANGGNNGRTTTATTAATHGCNPGDDDNNNFKIDGDLHQSDILELIYTFLSITVSCKLLSHSPFTILIQFILFFYRHILVSLNYNT